MYSSKSFIVSSLTFRFLINFDFIFVYGIRKWSNVIFFTHSYLDFPASLIEETAFFSIVYSCLLCHKLGDPRHVGLSLGFYPVPIILFPCVFLLQHHIVLIIVVLQHILKSGAWFLKLHLSYSRLLCLLAMFPCHFIPSKCVSEYTSLSDALHSHIKCKSHCATQSSSIILWYYKIKFQHPWHCLQSPPQSP